MGRGSVQTQDPGLRRLVLRSLRNLFVSQKFGQYLLYCGALVFLPLLRKMRSCSAAVVAMLVLLGTAKGDLEFEVKLGEQRLRWICLFMYFLLRLQIGQHKNANPGTCACRGRKPLHEGNQ